MDVRRFPPHVALVGRQIIKVVGSTIRRLREDRKLTQERFAQICGLDRSYYGRIERGTQNLALNTLCIVAHWLEVHPAELLQDIEDADLELLV